MAEAKLRGLTAEKQAIESPLRGYGDMQSYLPDLEINR